MWRQGLRLVVRDYQKPSSIVVRYTAFRVTFETVGDLYRATVTLYSAETTLKQHIDAVTKRVGDAVDQLEKVDRSVQKAARDSNDATDKLARQVASVESKLKSLESDLTSVDRAIQSIDRRVGTLERKQ
jgi:prefoldin subunit 5